MPDDQDGDGGYYGSGLRTGDDAAVAGQLYGMMLQSTGDRGGGEGGDRASENDRLLTELDAMEVQLKEREAEHLEETETIRARLEEQVEELDAMQGLLEESENTKDTLEVELDRLTSELEDMGTANATSSASTAVGEMLAREEDLRTALENAEAENQAMEQDMIFLEKKNQGGWHQGQGVSGSRGGGGGARCQPKVMM